MATADDHRDGGTHLDSLACVCQDLMGLVSWSEGQAARHGRQPCASCGAKGEADALASRPARPPDRASRNHRCGVVAVAIEFMDRPAITCARPSPRPDIPRRRGAADHRGGGFGCRDRRPLAVILGHLTSRSRQKALRINRARIAECRLWKGAQGGIRGHGPDLRLLLHGTALPVESGE